MDEEELQPKISYPEALFVGFWVVLIDVIEMIPLLNFLGDFFITDILFFPVYFYMYLKGVRGLYMIISGIMEAFPIVGYLPLRTIAFIVTVWVDHHPKLESKIEKGGQAFLLAKSAQNIKPATQTKPIETELEREKTLGTSSTKEKEGGVKESEKAANTQKISTKTEALRDAEHSTEVGFSKTPSRTPKSATLDDVGEIGSPAEYLEDEPLTYEKYLEKSMGLNEYLQQEEGEDDSYLGDGSDEDEPSESNGNREGDSRSEADSGGNNNDQAPTEVGLESELDVVPKESTSGEIGAEERLPPKPPVS